jgi:hypothetical protein
MYVTNGIEDVTGIPASAMYGRSFYHCIAENCVPDAVKCLESAKGNDLIACLRFWFRNPCIHDTSPEPESDSDEVVTTDINDDMEERSPQLRSHRETLRSDEMDPAEFVTSMNTDSYGESNDLRSRTSSGDSINVAIFGEMRETRPSDSSAIPSSGNQSSARPINKLRRAQSRHLLHIRRPHRLPP